ncbi:hypothetical protein WJX74_008113 [Apatococcus lobatus]|uniref:Uncharacterized protein n=1 Tax=Apatococcus lobatus TaxID=904363 RepID=A0AAW1RSF7_9CHLO
MPDVNLETLSVNIDDYRLQEALSRHLLPELPLRLLVCLRGACRGTRQLVDENTGAQWAQAAKGYLHPAFISQVGPLNSHGVAIQRSLRRHGSTLANIRRGRITARALQRKSETGRVRWLPCKHSSQRGSLMLLLEKPGSNIRLSWESIYKYQPECILKFAPQANSLLTLKHFSAGTPPEHALLLPGGLHVLLIWLTERHRTSAPPGYSAVSYWELAQRVSLRVVELCRPLRVTALRELTHAPTRRLAFCWEAHPSGNALAWRKGPGAVGLMRTQTLEDYAEIDLTAHPEWQSPRGLHSLENCLWSSDGRYIALLAECKHHEGEDGERCLLTIHCAETGCCLRTCKMWPVNLLGDPRRQTTTPFCWAHHRPVLAVWGEYKDQEPPREQPDVHTWPPHPHAEDLMLISMQEGEADRPLKVSTLIGAEQPTLNRMEWLADDAAIALDLKNADPQFVPAPETSFTDNTCRKVIISAATGSLLYSSHIIDHRNPTACRGFTALPGPFHPAPLHAPLSSQSPSPGDHHADLAGGLQRCAEETTTSNPFASSARNAHAHSILLQQLPGPALPRSRWDADSRPFLTEGQWISPSGTLVIRLVSLKEDTSQGCVLLHKTLRDECGTAEVLQMNGMEWRSPSMSGEDASLEWVPNSREAIYGFVCHSPTLYLVDANNHQVLMRLDGHDLIPGLDLAGLTARWSSLAWSPDARHLAVTSHMLATGPPALAVLSFS